MLDPTFGVGGFAQTAIGTDADSANAVAVQSDGKIVAGGSTVQNGIPIFALVRYNTDGSLDATFGSGGKATVSFGTSLSFSVLAALTIQPDGKIVGVGSGQGNVQVPAGGFPDYVELVRLNPNGSLDTTFGDKSGNSSTGKVLTQVPPSGAVPGTSMVLQPDGKIVVGGGYFKGTFGGENDFAVFRYTTAGKLDKTFGNGKGYITTDFQGRSDQVYGVALQSDGKIVAGGFASHSEPDGFGRANVALAPYNTNGTSDTTFGAGGKSEFDLSGIGLNSSAQSVGLQPLPTGSFRIVASGYSTTGTIGNQTAIMTVAAVNPSGNLDPTFGTGGVVKTPSFQLSSGLSGTVREAKSLTVQPDGKIVVGVIGFTTNYPNTTVGFGLVRYTADGAVDASFADNGISFTDQLNGKPIFLKSIALMTDGRIVAAGVFDYNPAGNNTSDFLVARYLGDPALHAPTAAANPTAAIVTDSEMQPLLTEAIARWQAAGADVSRLGTLDVRIADLGGTTLGLASGHTIWLDDNAAGWGWFVDPTPWDDSEFARPGDQGERGRMDSLSVLMHELGHVLGFEHEEVGVMADTLAAGVRRTPGSAADEALDLSYVDDRLLGNFASDLAVALGRKGRSGPAGPRGPSEP